MCTGDGIENVLIFGAVDVVGPIDPDETGTITISGSDLGPELIDLNISGQSL